MSSFVGCAIYVKENILNSLGIGDLSINTIIIGNSSTDIKMAKAVPMTSMLLRTSSSDAATENIIQLYHPDHVLDSIIDIPDAVTLLTENSMY